MMTIYRLLGAPAYETDVMCIFSIAHERPRAAPVAGTTGPTLWDLLRRARRSSWSNHLFPIP